MKTLYIGATSVCMEIDNHNPYYAPYGYTVFVNGIEYSHEITNVFSVFELVPESEYDITVRFDNGQTETEFFTSDSETCCINVKDFGAVGDGVHEDTEAIRTAICLMPEGGRLYFPKGTYLTAPLALKSHITLEISEEAVILGHPDRNRYPIVPGSVCDYHSEGDIMFGGFEGNAVPSYMSLMHASYAVDITITGKGVIDGNAQNSDWWQGFREFPAARPRMFFCNESKDVTLHGVILQNSPSWNIHPYYSKNVSIYNCKVKAPRNSPNTDGVDPESCDRVNIIGCRFSVGDDCIAVKSGKIELGRKYKRPADHHIIRNCLMEFGHAGVALGSEIAAGVKNLKVTRCFFSQTDRGLRIKTRRGRGKYCNINNVVFNVIKMDRVLTPLVINMWYNCVDPDGDSEYVWTRQKLPVDDRTPHLGSFTFKNMTCTNAEAAACYMDGLPESPIESVLLENINIEFAEDAKPAMPAMMTFSKECCRMGFYMDNVKDIRIKNVHLKGVSGEKLIAANYDSVKTEDFE